MQSRNQINFCTLLTVIYSLLSVVMAAVYLSDQIESWETVVYLPSALSGILYCVLAYSITLEEELEEHTENE